MSVLEDVLRPSQPLTLRARIFSMYAAVPMIGWLIGMAAYPLVVVAALAKVGD